MSEIRAAIQRQLLANQDTNILYLHAPRVLEIDTTFRDRLQTAARLAAMTPEELDSLVGFAENLCIRHVLRTNQYLRVTDRDRRRLAWIYRRTWKLVQRAGDVDAVLRAEHFPMLQEWIAALYPRSHLSWLVTRETVRPVCCRDYPAELQLEVLGLDVHEIRGPVLDVGCGFTAPLVRYLSACNIETYGFDRLVEEEGGCVRCEDWLAFDYSARSWGTIISHMALSNHYRYALHHDRALRSDLEELFLRILAALAQGGCFAYAPGAVELDRLVNPARFSIGNAQVVHGYTAAIIRRTAP